MTAYYNDFDPKACDWLEELIRRGLIAPGVVDRRSILDVEPVDLVGFTQCHFFAGIGGWSYASRLAGVPDDTPLWTGSPPCQPFSPAGKQLGKEDARHLSPKFASLVRACRPELLFGEQVASADVFGKAASSAGKRSAGAPAWAWLDDLSDRLEAAHYAVGASDIPAAGVGAPHIRQRTFFGAVRLADSDVGLADSIGAGLERQPRHGDGSDKPGRHDPEQARPASESGCLDGMADSESRRRGEERKVCGREPVGNNPQRGSAGHGASGRHCGVADATSRGRSDEREQCGGEHGLQPQDRGVVGQGNSGAQLRSDAGMGPGPTNGHWGYADWLFCRDGKWRPVEPGAFPLAHGIPARVVRLRGYGNAIVPQVAAVFIEAFLGSFRHLQLDTQQEDIFG